MEANTDPNKHVLVLPRTVAITLKKNIFFSEKQSRKSYAHKDFNVATIIGQTKKNQKHNTGVKAIFTF
jgi:hypothetical protein